MIQQTAFLHTFLIVGMCILMCVAFACMVRALKGPRITDRVVAMNMIGSLVTMMICMVSYLLEEAFLIVVAILYALLNMLAVVVLCRVATQRHYEVESEKKEDSHV